MDKHSPGTIRGSMADYWINEAGTGVWRRARKNHLCRGGLRGREHYIMQGERFLDTGERSGVWATYKCCQTCADSPSTVLSTPVVS
jgi:hypothetical protein